METPDCMGMMVFIWTLLGVSGMREEFKLLRDLLQEYDPAARPVKNLSDVVTVKMGVALFQIRELDEKNQFLQVNAWFQFHWIDPHLQWNASEYGGLKTLRIPSGRVWVPDIVLYNSVDETKPATAIFPETNAIVSDNGKVLWVIPAMIKSSCSIDITYFPFDEQRCPLKFGSWTYDGFQLDLVNLKDTGDLTKFIESGEWDLIGMPAQRNVEYYSCCVEPYVDVMYKIIIRRKPMFFTYNLVFPCVLLMGIGMLVFLLPPESGEKVSLALTAVLAMTMFQLVIAESIPPTSEVVPLIGQFFGATIFLLSLSSAMTVLIMKLHFSGEHGSRVPGWLRKLVLVCLARVVRMGDTASMTYKQAAATSRYSRGGGDPLTAADGGDLSLLNHNSVLKTDDGTYNMVLLNSLVHHASPPGTANTTGERLHNHNTPPPPPPPRARHRGNHHNGGVLTGGGSNHDSSGLDPHFDYGGVGGGGGGGGGESSALLCELLTHVRQINEEMHARHAGRESDDHYKSEWRMVALVLDRILLIIFFIMTLFTCVTIFVNVPH